jgi:hypothetical protein
MYNLKTHFMEVTFIVFLVIQVFLYITHMCLRNIEKMILEIETYILILAMLKNL